jgi:DNA-directed RNA polymerase subunit RPC12/RpoP
LSLVAAKSQARLLRDHLEAVGKGVAEAAKIIKWQSNEAVNVENDAKMPIEDVDIKVEEIDCCMDIPGDVAVFHVKTEMEDTAINLDKSPNNYNCNHCDYEYVLKRNLVQHEESVHKGIKYDCEYCNYKATLKISLLQHIKTVHKGFVSNIMLV